MHNINIFTTNMQKIKSFSKPKGKKSGINLNEFVSEKSGLPSLGKGESSLLGRRRKGRKKMLTVKVKSTPLDEETKEYFWIDDYYEIKEQIGFGTYSQVKIAVNKATGEEWVAKICKGETSITLLKAEKEILDSLNCKFTPKVYDLKIDRTMNKGYLLMEYLKGETLDQFMKNYAPLDSDLITDIIRQLCEIVEVLHNARICHRDIKPENVLVTENNELKLIDFNISKMWEEESGDWATKFKGCFLTQVWSPLYAAPELQQKDFYNESIDIWGIGTITNFILANNGEDNYQNLTAKPNSLEEHALDFLSKTLSDDPSWRMSASECLAHPFLMD